MIKRIMLLVAALGCQACGQETIEPYKVDSFAGREIPAAQKKAAQALSIGNASALTYSDSPYTQAVLCDVATDTVLGPYRNSAQLDQTQQAAMGQLLELFDKRVQSQAREAQKSASELAQDRESLAEQFMPTRPAKAKVALACIREIEGFGDLPGI
ncbi:hypothetical protein AAG604_15700 [Citromicrobium bathyomarinum]